MLIPKKSRETKKIDDVILKILFYLLLKSVTNPNFLPPKQVSLTFCQTTFGKFFFDDSLAAEAKKQKKRTSLYTLMLNML